MELNPRAARLRDAIDAAGWTVTISGRDLFQQSPSRATLDVESIHARRGEEVITATWVDGWALGPIGWHSDRNFTHAVKNAATAKRCASGECAHARPG